MKASKIIGGGVLAGVVFYALSMIVWALFKFLPIVPLPLAITQQGLGQGWQIIHLLVSLFVGIMWAIGYAVYGRAREGGWLYGLVVFIVGLLPAFTANFIIAPDLRAGVVYGAIVALIGALLGGKAIAMVMKR